MATTTASIINNAETILQDSGNDRYAAAELLIWLNYGQIEIVRAKPDANPSRAQVQLSSGIWQSLPSGSTILLDVSMNMGTDGSTRGTPVTLVERKWIDAALPGWTTASAKSKTTHVIYDPKTNPTEYMVYPPSNGNGYIEIVTAALPSDAAIDGDISIGDEFAPVLLDYILYRAYSKDSDYVENAQRAVAHYQSFLSAIDRLDMVELLMYPKKVQEKS